MHSWVYIHIMHIYKHIYFHQHNKKKTKFCEFHTGHSSDNYEKETGKISKQKCSFMLEDSKDLIFKKIRNLKISILDNFSLSSGLLLWHCSRLCKVYLGHSTHPKSVPVLHIHLQTPLAYTILHFPPSHMSYVSNNSFKSLVCSTSKLCSESESSEYL